MPQFLLALLAGLLATQGPVVTTTDAAPWGAAGHRIIARVAESRLSQPALAEIRRLLNGQTIVDVATWADQIRNERPAASPWHYVDIPTTDTTYDSLRWCPGGNCVVGALERQIAILGDKSRPDSARSEALKWVVHLTEDIHQPLHAGDRGDRGGNDVKLTMFGKQSNLHSVWDSGLLTAMKLTDDEFVADIEQQIAHRTDLAKLGSGSPPDWAMQSHDVSRDVVYRFLPQSLELDQGYVDACRAAVMEQLVRASVRLTAVLERTLGH
jgi:hypothetical protein